MAEDLTRREQQLREINRLGFQYTDILKSQQAAMKELNKDHGERVETQEAFNSSAKVNLSLAMQLSTASKENLKSLKKEKKLQDTISDAKRTQKNLELQISELLKEGTTESIQRARILTAQLDTSRALVKEARKLTDTYRALNDATAFFDQMADLVEDIPVIRKIFPEFKRAAEAARDAFAETDSTLKTLMAGVKSLSGAIAKGFIGGLLKGMFGVDERVTKISRNLGIARSEAATIEAQAASLSMEFEAATQNTIQFQKALGFVGNVGMDMVRTSAILQERMGLSAENAAALYDASRLSGQSLKQFSNELVGTVKIQNILTGQSIDYMDVLSSINETSELTRLSISKFPGGIAAAAFQARKLGLSFSVLEGSSSNLLDFESSIQSELEAELLIGRQLNLQKARELALKGDLAGVGKEILKQVGSEEEFLKMNIIQRQALAKSVGLTAEELAKSFNIQKRDAELAKIVEKTAKEKISLEAKIASLRADGLSEEEAMSRLKQEMGDAEFKRQLVNESFQEKLLQLGQDLTRELSKLTGFGTDFNGILEKVKGKLDASKDTIKTIAKVFGVIGGLAIFGKVFAMARTLTRLLGKLGKFAGKPFSKLFSSADDMVMAKSGKMYPKSSPQGKMITNSKNLAKAGKLAKGGAKGLLGKAGPIAAAAMGIYDAAQGYFADREASVGQRLKNAGSSALSGLTFGLLGKDADEIKAIAQERKDQNIQTTSEETTAINPTNIQNTEGKTVPELLELIYQATVQGQNIYLDGRKVGESLALSYNTQ